MVDQEFIDQKEKQIENSNLYAEYVREKHVIKDDDINNVELVTLLKRQVSKGDLGLSIFCIIIGIPLCLFIFGIALIVFGAMNIKRWQNNADINHECVAYSPSRKQIILFEIHKVNYGFDPREIKYISHDGNDNIARAVVKINDREKFFYLGKATYEGVQSCNFELGKLQKQLNEEENI